MELCLGCINLKKAIGSSTYFPVVSKVRSLGFNLFIMSLHMLLQTYWTLSMDGLAINGTEQFADGVVAVGIFVDHQLLTHLNDDRQSTVAQLIYTYHRIWLPVSMLWYEFSQS